MTSQATSISEAAPATAPVLPERLLQHCRVLPHRYFFLQILPKQLSFVEVGVGLGVFTQQVFDACDPKHFTAIDTFTLDQCESLWGVPSEQALEGLSHEAFYERRFSRQIAEGRLSVRKGHSVSELHSLEDGTADLVYVDADHTYHAAKQDLEAARTKIRPTGRIVANDYIMLPAQGDNAPFGVVQAVNEFMIRHDYAMEFFILQEAMFCDVVLTPRANLTNPDMSLTWGANPQEIQTLKTRLAAMEASTSWRMTGTLRKAVTAWRSLRSSMR